MLLWKLKGGGVGFGQVAPLWELQGLALSQQISPPLASWLLALQAVGALVL